MGLDCVRVALAQTILLSQVEDRVVFTRLHLDFKNTLDRIVAIDLILHDELVAELQESCRVLLGKVFVCRHCDCHLEVVHFLLQVHFLIEVVLDVLRLYGWQI